MEKVGGVRIPKEPGMQFGKINDRKGKGTKTTGHQQVLNKIQLFKPKPSYNKIWKGKRHKYDEYIHH